MSDPNAVWPDGTRWAVEQAHDQWMKRSQFDPTMVATAILTALEPFVQQRIATLEDAWMAAFRKLKEQLDEYDRVLRDHNNTATPQVLRGLLDQFKTCRAEVARLREDGERLDWLERQGANAITTRAAIDAARSAPGEGA